MKVVIIKLFIIIYFVHIAFLAWCFVLNGTCYFHSQNRKEGWYFIFEPFIFLTKQSKKKTLIT